MEKRINELLSRVENLGAKELLLLVAADYRGKAIFTTSFGIEDQVITDIIFRNNIDIEVATLDTGRLFEETYKAWSNTIKRYGKPIVSYSPEASSVEKLVTQKGPFSFYRSIEERKECCNIRKVLPLNRALEGKELWVTGIRADQSSGRGEMKMVEADEARGIIKIHPLFNWTLEQVEEYIKKNNVPYNELHDKGFVSIGCAPCTRAIKPGEDFRAGRWWWENQSGKECGLHQ